MNSPLVWFGGKGMLKSWIVPQLMEYSHKIYCEPFGGGASVLLHKEPVPAEVCNDLNGDLVSFFRILADPDRFEQFRRIVGVLPNSREMYGDYRATWQSEDDPIKRAAKWFYVARNSFAGKFGRSWAFTVASSGHGMASSASTWLGALAGLPEVHERLQRVQIENLPALEIIRKYDTGKTLFYCDPPYILDTRNDKKETYQHEMDDGDQAELVEQLLAIKGSAVLSGYDHEIYSPLTKAGWSKNKKETCCMAVGRTRGTGLQGRGKATAKQKRTECLYLSPQRQRQRLFEN